jgi:hypothetical protein
LPDRRVGEILARNHTLELHVDLLKVGFEKGGFDFCEFVKLNEGILEHNFVLLVEGISDDLGHVGDECGEVFAVFALGCGKQVGDGFECFEFDVE